ncbi:MAG: DNA-directed RNA polymerase subunit omega [Phycisphaerales bacterium]|nr:DNA-directed RNA polymerase subunit omega [Phycisphaerales bacterium]
MIQGLKSDDLVNKAGGRFKLASLIQRRLVEILQGARPLVDTRGLTDLEVVVQEFLEDKIDIKHYDPNADDDDIESDI